VRCLAWSGSCVEIAAETEMGSLLLSIRSPSSSPSPFGLEYQQDVVRFRVVSDQVVVQD
jgi:hypothetical protein